ncbi:aminotransferase class IV [Nafulsella turpanensis]|uniref:aminotransferase class IV n=1 Tax=Nafulsella turpanensis TaxID=1265690 RepID=UPI00034660AB|nr:aminotransferase class IV [Nafulsella turpanensis]
MEVLFNGKLYNEQEIRLQKDNRAFCYGDGIFETMVTHRGSSPLLSLHYERLRKGALVLHLHLPFSLQELEAYIWQLSTQFPDPVLRMRLQIWRKPGGLYTPQQEKTDFLMTASPFKKPEKRKEKAAFATGISLSYSPFSSLKTMNALPYVLAGIEKQQKGLAEIILTNEKDQVAEAGAANLFWLKDGNWYTPHLRSGCIAGVMRAHLIKRLKAQKQEVKEVLLPKEKLREADALFGCNVTGIFSIIELEGHVFEDQWENLAEQLQFAFL